MSDAEAPAKAPPGDMMKLYTVFMGVLALAVGVYALVLHGERKDYERALAEAPSLFGGKPRAGSVTSLALDVKQYLESYRNMKVRPDETVDIPFQKISEQVTASGMSIKSGGKAEAPRPNYTKGYEDVSSRYDLENSRLSSFVTALYNIEASSPKLRTLELNWNLIKEEPKNPYPPGNAIDRVNFTVGFRRPVAKR